jgi:hypothetical protein
MRLSRSQPVRLVYALSRSWHRRVIAGASGLREILLANLADQSSVVGNPPHSCGDLSDRERVHEDGNVAALSTTTRAFATGRGWRETAGKRVSNCARAVGKRATSAAPLIPCMACIVAAFLLGRRLHSRHSMQTNRSLASIGLLVVVPDIADDLGDHNDIRNEPSRARSEEQRIRLIPPGDRVASNEIDDVKNNTCKNI